MRGVKRERKGNREKKGEGKWGEKYMMCTPAQ